MNDNLNEKTKEINQKYGLQNFYIDASIKSPIKTIDNNTQINNKPKQSYAQLKQKYRLQDFYIDASIQQPTKKRKSKPTFNLKELIKNKRV